MITFCTRAIISVTLVLVVTTPTLKAEVLDYVATEKKCIDFVKQFGRDSFCNHSSEFLTQFTDLALVDLLRGNDFPLLRLLCYYESKVRNTKSNEIALVRLLARAASVDFYEKEFQSLIEQSRLDSIAVAKAFSKVFGEEMSVGMSNTSLGVETLLLRGFSNDCILTLSESCIIDKWSVPPTLPLIHEIERRKFGKSDLQIHENKKEILKQIRDLPGRAQTVVVQFYPFESNEALIHHIRSLLCDDSVSTIEVVLAVLDKAKLVIANESLILMGASNQKLATDRISELKQRMR